MAIGFAHFPVLTPEQANPLGYGWQQGANIAKLMAERQLQQLEAEKARQLMPFVTPMAQQQLAQAKQKTEWDPRIWQSEIGLRGAQSGLAGAEKNKINYMLSHPGFLGGDETKTLEALKAMGYNINPNQSAPLNSSNVPTGTSANEDITKPPSLNQIDQNNSASPFKTGNPLVDAILNRKFATSAYQKKMTEGFNYIHSPVDAKNYMIAQLAGAGIDPSESVNLLTAGYTVPQILESKGFDPKNAPDPDFLPTRGNIQTLVQRRAALKEVESLGDFVREGLGPYSRTVMGFSPSQMRDALLGMNEEQQSDFLAARGLAPELSNVRLMLAQARTGKYAMQSMIDKSMTNASAFRPLVSEKVWDAAQRKMDAQLGKAFAASEKAYKLSKGKEKNKSDPLGIR